MAAKRQRPAESWTYVLLDDRKLPPEKQSVFTLRPLTQTDRAAVMDEIARVHTAADGTKSVITRSRRQGIELAIEHIVSVENFPAGAPEPWPKDHAGRRNYLEGLHDEYVQELGNEVWNRSVIADDVKNS